MIKRLCSLALLLSASFAYGQIFARECSSQQLQYMATVRTQNPETIHELFCVTNTGVVTQDSMQMTNATIKYTSLSALFLVNSSTAPTVAGGACGGSAAAVTGNNGNTAVYFSVGTAPGTTCTIGFPAGTHGWYCTATDLTNPTTGGGFYIKTTSNTTTTAVLTFYNTAGVATAPTASDSILASCSST
jgi:hypothetical protein